MKNGGRPDIWAPGRKALGATLNGLGKAGNAINDGLKNIGKKKNGGKIKAERSCPKQPVHVGVKGAGANPGNRKFANGGDVTHTPVEGVGKGAFKRKHMVLGGLVGMIPGMEKAAPWLDMLFNKGGEVKSKKSRSHMAAGGVGKTSKGQY
jgi:hypothetical protein